MSTGLILTPSGIIDTFVLFVQYIKEKLNDFNNPQISLNQLESVADYRHSF